MKFSPDVLAANPNLAAKLKRSKSRTPSGKGRGHTDDEQSYAAAGTSVSLTAQQQVSVATKQYLGLLRWYAGPCGISDDAIAHVAQVLAKFR